MILKIDESPGSEEFTQEFFKNSGVKYLTAACDLFRQYSSVHENQVSNVVSAIKKGSMAVQQT